jgi:hypothetical protein
MPLAFGQLDRAFSELDEAPGIGNGHFLYIKNALPRLVAHV